MPLNSLVSITATRRKDFGARVDPDAGRIHKDTFDVGSAQSNFQFFMTASARLPIRTTVFSCA